MEATPQDKPKDQSSVYYLALVEYSVTMYLGTVLYRYFLPFVSQKDIICIKNSMKMYLSTVRSARLMPFAPNVSGIATESDLLGFIEDDKVINLMNEIPKILYDLLKDFRGIEAFFQVEAASTGSNRGKDTRKVHSIKPLMRDTKQEKQGPETTQEENLDKKKESQCRPYVHCLFV